MHHQTNLRNSYCSGYGFFNYRSALFNKINGMVKVGDKFMSEYGNELKVMAVLDGYAMCRVKGCVPVVYSTKEIIRLQILYTSSKK